MDKEIKILLIDDEPDFTKPMGYWLNSKGYAVDSANDAASGIQKIKDNPPDIVFLDLNMPVMNGIEAIKKIREFNKGIPIIVISAYLDHLQLNEAKEFGISGVFYKGGDFKEGLLLIESALRMHKKLKNNNN